MMRPAIFLQPLVVGDRGAELGTRQAQRAGPDSASRKAVGVGGQRREVARQLGAVAAGIEIGQVPFRQRSPVPPCPLPACDCLRL